MDNRVYLTLALVFAFIIILAYPTIVKAASSLAQVFLNGSSPYGKHYSDWIVDWWKWNMNIPKQEHPMVNPNVPKCPVGESGNVSFLTHSYQGVAHYSCMIPTTHSILVPISSGECTTDEAHSNAPSDLINCASAGDQYLTFEANVDGVPLIGLEKNYAITKIFNMTVPVNNAFDLRPGTFKDGAGGYFIFLKPLTSGSHNIGISARVINPTDPSFNYNYQVGYTLTVK